MLKREAIVKEIMEGLLLPDGAHLKYTLLYAQGYKFEIEIKNEKMFECILANSVLDSYANSKDRPAKKIEIHKKIAKELESGPGMHFIV